MKRAPTGTMKALVQSLPAMPEAACRGRDPNLFEFDALPNETATGREERHAYALAVCRGCCQLEVCKAWVGSLPKSQMNGQIIGGRVLPSTTYNKPKEMIST